MSLETYLRGRRPRANPGAGRWKVEVRRADVEAADLPFFEIAHAESYDDALAELILPAEPLVPLTLARLTPEGPGHEEFWLVRDDGRTVRLPPLVQVAQQVWSGRGLVEWVEILGANWPYFWASVPRGDWALGIAEQVGGLEGPCWRATCAIARRVTERLSMGALREQAMRIVEALADHAPLCSGDAASPTSPRWSPGSYRALLGGWQDALRLQGRVDIDSPDARVLSVLRTFCDLRADVTPPLSDVAAAAARVADVGHETFWATSPEEESRVCAHYVTREIPLAALLLALPEALP